MRAFTVLSVLVVAVSSVLASHSSTSGALIARQATTPNVPAQCSVLCSYIDSLKTCGSDIGCMCTDAMGRGMVDCGNCAIKYGATNNADMTTYKNMFQSSVDSYVDSCTQSGHPIGPYKIDGSSSSNPPPAGSGTGTGAAPASTGSPNGAASVRAGGAFAGLALIAVGLVL
ncbi:hypothetical protein FRC12_023307 [Ceratobasidium sp. 428]|nr:hypothetical protein FRC12_023307 [Ceratobasidium sp. 428]